MPTVLLSFLTISRPIKGLPDRLCLASRALVRGCADRQGWEQSANRTVNVIKMFFIVGHNDEEAARLTTVTPKLTTRSGQHSCGWYFQDVGGKLTESYHAECNFDESSHWLAGVAQPLMSRLTSSLGPNVTPVGHSNASAQRIALIIQERR